MRLPHRIVAVAAAVLLIAQIAISTGWGQKLPEPTAAQARRLKEAAKTSDIDRDEVIVFFETAAHLDKDGATWVIPIHGVIYEPTVNPLRRSAMAVAIGRLADSDEDASKSLNLIRILDHFLVDNERGQDISIRIGNRVVNIGKSKANGHFQDTIRLRDADIQNLLVRRGQTTFLPFEAVLQTSDRRRFVGRAYRVPQTGLSIISDIDDNIKHSEVTDAEAVLENTFLFKFQAAPGMPELYQTCARKGITFHYVSGSPWQLYLPLLEFFDAEKLPRGSFALKHFRLKNPSTAADMLRSPQEAKLNAIEQILAAYPQRRFLLIGDSGEKDPEIYSATAQSHPEQVVGIFIRNVTNDQLSDTRFQKVTKELGKIPFRLFTDPNELSLDIEAINRDHGTPSTPPAR
ncbi:phosphatidate phosphatase App1 family protein [Symmachiella macrocystis]|uniref:phosphatidate phosphatase App1 family protein n=1 Tax=Symmachiella macrocystis TaxID=2527985 RepID=UPI0018D4001A|nr:App1 family protein [Symmachiella macrocystis]